MGITEIDKIDQKTEEKSAKCNKVISHTMDHQTELNNKFSSLTMDQPAELDNFMVLISFISSFLLYNSILWTVVAETGFS